MSGIGGIFDLGGGSVDSASLDAIAGRLEYRSPDGMGSWVNGPIGLIHGRFWTTPEEVGEEQPVSRKNGRLRIAADARIDNRAELLRDLEGRVPAVGADDSDARLILAAYEAYGVDFCARLLGDFSFAIWDGDGRRLLLARDAMGLRQLYWTVSDQRLVFSNSLGAVLAGVRRQPALNRPLIEDFLKGKYRPWTYETVFEGVWRLPPGQRLTACSEGLKQRGFWRPGATFAGGISSDREWIDGFRSVFQEAVACRLRSTTRVGVVAGGGVDSAAIACVAGDGLMAKPALELDLYSLVFSESSAADETEYLDLLDAWLAESECHRIDGERNWALRDWEADDDYPLDEPEVYLLKCQTRALFGAAAGNGCRVVLAGEGANQVLGHAFYYDPTAVAHVGRRDLVKELAHFRSHSKASTARLLFHALLRPHVPLVLETWWRRIKGAKAPAAWIEPQEPGHAAERPRPPVPPEARHLPPLARWALQSVNRPHDLARYSALDVTAAHAGVEWRLPFLDLRVVDYLLHVPCRMRSWQGEDRIILRESMTGGMPEKIRTRRSKSHIVELIDKGLKERERKKVENLLDNPRSEALGFVRAHSLNAAFAAFWSDQVSGFDLHGFLGLESWLRRNDRV